MQPPTGADSLDRTIRGRWATIAPNVQTIADKPRGTIVPAHLTPSTGGRQAMRLLADLGVPLPGRDGALVLEGTLGQGGMGVVRAGTQASLGRKVAIKSLRDDLAGEAAALMLLREAWVTGALEHPNVMPVYDIGLDAAGRPLVVLKRIEGTGWNDRLAALDLLGNLRVLLQVCDALRFAHSRGILHRDVKPENVMIGEFGEVYLLDWGIAVSLADDGSGRFPLARDAREMAGTPCYMAPEMLGGDGAHLSVRTDVYLLGSVLFEIVTGEPPHRGDDVMGIVRSVIRSDPGPLPGAPEELAVVIRRAMAADPLDRYADVDSFKAALERHIAHRGALALIDEAERRLEDLGAGLGQADRTSAYNRFGACRFGFRQALVQWPDSEAAAGGLFRAVATMASWELDRGNPDAAEALLAELERPPPELAARVLEARRAQKAEQDRIRALERLEAQFDPVAGKRTRYFLTMLMGTAWTVLPLMQRHGPLAGAWESYWGLLVWAASMTAILATLGLWGWESMSRTAINRAIMRAGLAVTVGSFTLHLGHWLMGAPPEESQISAIFWWAGVVFFLAAWWERRLATPALGFVAAFLVASARPDWRFYCMSLGNAVLVLTVARIWRPSSWRGEYT